jgi:carbon storage regulator
VLILSRRGGEAVKIGEDVTVTVLESRGGQVRIGIDAPSSIEEEICRRIRDWSWPARPHLELVEPKDS